VQCNAVLLVGAKPLQLLCANAGGLRERFSLPPLYQRARVAAGMLSQNGGVCIMDKSKIKLRILAVLEYDAIPQCKRAKHLANACGCSRSTARRLLTVERDAGAMNSRWLLDLADGLNVNWLWLYDGNFEKFDPRTARIQLSKIERWSHVEIEDVIYPLLCGVEGEPDFLSVGYGYSLNDVIILEQRRRMTEWEKNKHLRLGLRLLNNDPKALRMAEMCARGQITRAQLFNMI
jgi:hypothetical protein